MGYGNIRQWIEQLGKDKDLAVIDTPVDPCLELAEIHRRVIQEEGPALLFTNVMGTPYPVVTNLFGTPRRVNQAFGSHPEQLMKSMSSAMEPLFPLTLGGLWNEKKMLWEMLKVGTKNVSQGEAPVLGVCRSTDSLKELPRITSWQEDGEAYIALPLVYTESISNSNNRNLGLYRVRILDDNTTTFHWHTPDKGALHHHEADSRGEALPVSIFIGGPPGLVAAAMARLPERMSKLVLASMLLDRRLPMVNDPMGGHRIPAEAEFAIRGLVTSSERLQDGSIGNYYRLSSAKKSVMHVQRMWHRKDAIYPASLMGQPGQEDYYLGAFLQRMLTPLYPLIMPSVCSLWTYAESGLHSLASAVVRESNSREALLSAFRILGEGPLSETKLLLVTNEPVELSNFPRLLETVIERFDPAADLFIFNNNQEAEFDYNGHTTHHGSKGIMLGVGDPIRELPRSYDDGVIPGIQEAVPYCGGCLIVSGPSYTEEPALPKRLSASLLEKETEWPLIIIVDSASEAVKTQSTCLWTVFTHLNPATDIYAEFEVKNHHMGYKLPIVIDARIKPGYPTPAELQPEKGIVDKVDRNWKHYFPTA